MEFKPLGDIATVTKLAGYEFTKYINYNDSGEIIAIRGLNIKNGYLKLDDIKKINKAVSDNLLRSKLYKNDIVLTYTGTLGQSAIITENDKYHLAPNVAKITLLSEYNPYFYFLYFQSQNFLNQIDMYSVGSTQKTIPMKNIRLIPVPIISLENQNKLANFFKRINDKIDNNKMIIANLEELSQTLFKRWFVDFEFPSDKDISYKSGEGQFIDSLPIGWIRTRADSLYSINIGKTPPRKLRDLFSDYEGEKWVSISDMKEDGPYLFDTKEYLNPKAVKEYRVKVAPENSILLSFKLTIGRVKIAHTDLTTNEAIAHFIQTDKSPPYEYTYLYLKYFNYNELGNTSSIATAVNSKIIKAMPILVPDIKTLTKFQEIVSPLFNSIRSYQLQNKNLIELRDTLLPKLMSGEIELPDELEVDKHAELLQ